MAERLLVSQVGDEEGRAPWTLSLLGHAAILLMLLLGVELRRPQLIELGGGPGGPGADETITVGLVGELGGGAGMVKPAVERRPQAFAPPEKKEAPEIEPKPSDAVFERPKPEVKKEPKDWRKERAAPEPEKLPPAPAGVVPQPARPGSGGPTGETAGAGAGGVLIGAGPGYGGVDSWYVRQVERRVGDNWLKTALGDVAAPVVTKISFEIAQNGQIQSIEILESSGIERVDRAARRAVLASNPLPPLPFELRRRRIKFVANFQYPPR